MQFGGSSALQHYHQCGRVRTDDRRPAGFSKIRRPRRCKRPRLLLLLAPLQPPDDTRKDTKSTQWVKLYEQDHDQR